MKIKQSNENSGDKNPKIFSSFVKIRIFLIALSISENDGQNSL